MSFQSETDYATEFALRTQMNLFTLLEIECRERGDERGLAELQERVIHARDNMDKLRYRQLSYCSGTQAINSLLGLLVIPQTQFYNDLFLVNWDKLRRLEKYVKHKKGEYNNTYYYFSKKKGMLMPESDKPSNVLKHMRNAVAHKKFEVWPESSPNCDEVTHIRFKDYIGDEEEQSEYRFNILIEIDDLIPILLEISDLIVELELKKRGI